MARCLPVLAPEQPPWETLWWASLPQMVCHWMALALRQEYILALRQMSRLWLTDGDTRRTGDRGAGQPYHAAMNCTSVRRRGSTPVARGVRHRHLSSISWSVAMFCAIGAHRSPAQVALCAWCGQGGGCGIRYLGMPVWQHGVLPCLSTTLLHLCNGSTCSRFKTRQHLMQQSMASGQRSATCSPPLAATGIHLHTCCLHELRRVCLEQRFASVSAFRVAEVHCSGFANELPCMWEGLRLGCFHKVLKELLGLLGSD
jgi:hypothetical protein